MSKLRSNVLYQAVYHVLSVCIPLVTSPYLSRVLGAEGLGVYSYNYSIVSYFILLALLGVSTYGMRTISQSRGNEEISRNFFGIYFFQLFTSLLSLLVYVVFVLIFIHDPIGKTVSFVHIIYLVGECLNINWLFFGLEKHKEIVIRNIIIKLLTVASIFLFVRKPEDVILYTLILAASHAISNAAIWLRIRGSLIRVSITLKDITKHIKPNIILFIPVLAASVYHIMDKTMLGMFSDNANSGYYYNADKLLNIPLTMITGCSVAFMTQACSLTREGDNKELKKIQNESIYFGMCLISVIAFGVCAVAAEFVPWFFGAGYEPCISLIKYFALIVIFKTVSSHTRNVFLIPESNDKSYAKAITCGALINLVANYILIAYFELGALGATLGTLIAEFIVVISQIVFMKSAHSRKNCVKGIFCSCIYLVLGFIMFMVIELIPLHLSSLFFAILIKIMLGACIYILECFLLWRIFPSVMPSIIKETLLQLKRKLLKKT